MVRKKLKKAAQPTHEVSVQHRQRLDPIGVFFRWLEDLGLALGEGGLPPALSPRLDVFGLLQGSTHGQFALVKGLQTLRAKVLQLKVRG